MNQIVDCIKTVLKKEIIPTVKKQNTLRIVSLDVMKLIAAFGVVFYHFAYYKLDYGFIANQVYYPNLNRIVMCFFAYSVPMFFLVNGILLFKEERSWKVMYYKASKILVLTVVWSLLGFPSWFFRTLLIIYLLFPGLQYLRKYYFRGFVMIEGFLFLMPFVYNYIVLALRINGVEQFQVTGLFTMYGLFYFMLGSQVDLHRIYPIWSSALLILLGWGMIVFECTVYTNLDQMVYDGVNHAFPTIGALLLMLGLFQIITCIQTIRSQMLLSFLSDGVLPIYLMHMTMIRGIKLLAGSFQIALLPALFISSIICVVCCLLGKILVRIPIICAIIKI